MMEMEHTKKYRLQAEEVSTDSGLKSVFDSLMGLEKWDDDSLDSWIDLIFSQNSLDPAKNNDPAPEIFYLEVDNSRMLKRRQLLKLTNQVRQVNHRCIEKIGTPLLALMLI